MSKEINEHYHSDNPRAYGGKKRLYEIYNKKDVDCKVKSNQ